MAPLDPPNIVPTLTDHASSVVESFTLPVRDARFSNIPSVLTESKVGQQLVEDSAIGGQLWSHQAAGIDIGLSGKNVVVSTGTASGKSLIFRSVAFHRLLNEPELRVVVFYPLKALSADQFSAWKKHATDLGLPEDTVGRIDGTVPMKNRLSILSDARIILMTPDVCHAWMMSNLAEGAIRNFLAHVSLVVLDEAHTMEGVFGSNFAFLFRRLRTARNFLHRSFTVRLPLQIVAATATILNPASHLELLSGLPFKSIGEDSDGSPQQERRCIHATSPDGVGSKALTQMLAELLAAEDNGTVIIFVDSRKGVEHLAAGITAELGVDSETEVIAPYRAGFEPEDRARIEQRLKAGLLRGVVSTSALELGIDMPSLAIGLNIGVPPTRKSYRQRLGRIGRARPGAFVVLAEEQAFRRFGTTFAEYHALSVEPSYLYLDNRFMQFAHARCLVDELDALGIEPAKALKPGINWPPGFEEVFETAKPGQNLPREFDAIAQLGSDVPQRGYPLRNVGELSLKVARGNSEESFGELTLSQAIRECYPGAIYYHLAKPYKVYGWKTSWFDARIRVAPIRGLPRTKPRIQTWANVGLTSDQILDNHYLEGELGYMAECEMQITERVQGFQDAGGNYHSYTELREKEPSMRPKSRMFRTSGVVIFLKDEWFAAGSNRNAVAALLTEIFSREYSVLPQDVGSAATNVSVSTVQGTERNAKCIVIFDQTYGSLRLTERLYSEFDHLLDLVERAAEELPEDTPDSWNYGIRLLRGLRESLAPAPVEAIDSLSIEKDGLMQVFSPGSIVAYRETGALHTLATIKEPFFYRTGEFGYRVEWKPPHAGSPVIRWIAARFLEPPGDDSDWSYCYWDPETGQFSEGEEGISSSPDV